MSDDATLRLATLAGLAREWMGADGRMRIVEIGVLRSVLAALGLPAGTEAECRTSEGELAHRLAPASTRLLTAEIGTSIALPGRPGRWRIALETGGSIEGEGDSVPQHRELPAGYHRLEAPDWSGILAVAPGRCWSLEDAGAGQRMAGLAVQLASLCRPNDGGIGDFAALSTLAGRAAVHGIDALAVSPIHALFIADPARCSPYTPSSRIALNPAFIPLTLPEQPGEDLIDWPASVRARLAVLRKDFARDAAGDAFAAFCRDASPALRLHALFDAISAAQVAKGEAADCCRWPAEFATPESAGSREFLRASAAEVAFHLYLQQRAGAGLAAAAQAARQGGMRIGLIADLAVGVHPGGSDAWAHGREMLRGVSIGAPPDAFNLRGQCWGLTTYSPFGLRESGFAGWIAMLRAALAQRGGIRIDHAMGLARLWLVPDGAEATEGVYLAFPCRDLLRLVALESARHRAVVLAEDLGTLPHDFPALLAAHGMASLRVLWFEREMPDGFRPPHFWQRLAAAMTSTHDLPTVAGWWQGRDLDWREKLGLAGDTPGVREHDRHLLWRAFRDAGAVADSEPATHDGARAADAAASFLGRTASLLALLPLEDALAESEQPNLPGTTTEHPNWRRRLSSPVDTMLDRSDVAARLSALRAARAQPT